MRNLGDRMKEYENVGRIFLTKRTPVVVRVDGRAFHTYTKGFRKPFDSRLISAMEYASFKLATEAQGFKMGYMQSDEFSMVLTDYDTLETEPWFGNNKSKIEAISASVFTSSFNISANTNELSNNAVFDARAFNLPESEVANYFLWRAKDWKRNSLSMYCRSVANHKEMVGKNQEEQHDILYKYGKNWAIDLTDREKNGTWFLRVSGKIEVCCDILPNFDQISENFKKVMEL